MVAPESTPEMDVRERNRNDSLGVGVRNFSGGPVVMMSPSKAGVQVRSLVRELRSYMPHGQKNKTLKQKQCSNKFNKDF